MKSKMRKNKKEKTEFRAIGFERARELAKIESLSNPPTSPVSPQTISVASSWEEQDLIDKRLYDKFVEGQLRVNKKPVVVNTCKRRLMVTHSIICNPTRMEERFDKNESFRRNSIENFSWLWDEQVKSLEESTLRNISRHFSQYVASYLDYNDIFHFPISTNPSTPTSTCFEFTTPGSPYYVELREGGECIIIPNSKSSPYAMMEFEEAKKLRDFAKISPLNHCLKPSNNVLDKKKRYSTVRFDSLELKEMFENAKDSPICVTGALDYSKTQNSVTIEVTYNCLYDKTCQARLKLARTEDVQFAENVLLKHGLLMRYAIDKYGDRCTEMLLTNFPSFVNSDEYLTWFMHNIFDPNGIEFKSVCFESEHARKLSTRNSFFGTNFDPRFIMSFDLMRLVYRARLRPKGNIVTTRDLKEFVSDPDNLPFHLTDSTHENGERQLTAHFSGENTILGEQLGGLCLMNVNDVDFMRFTASRKLPARISPKFRRMLPLPRSVRHVCQAGVKAFDVKMKMMLKDYYTTNGRDKNIDHSMVRIVDDYASCSEDGLTGIEGWPSSIVDYCFDEFRKVFTPEVIDISDKYEKFLYGVGESYVRNLVSNNSIVVDIDQYRRKMTIYGDATDAFVEMLNNFENAKSTTFRADIPLREPQGYSVLMGMLNNQVVGQIGSYLKANVRIDSERLSFRGSATAYETLKNMIFSTKNEIRSALCPNAFDYSICPVCLCSIPDNFYRLKNCGHIYCYECICDMVRALVGTAQFGAKCCFEQCEMTISPMDIKRIILGDENRVKLLDAEKLQTLNARAIDYIVTKPESTIKVCKTVDCIGILQSSNNLEQNEVHCAKCQKTYCAQCLEEPHPHVELCEHYERMRRDVEYSLKTFTSATGDEKFRRCPTEKCQAVIEKDEGCNHVECPYCHCHFCWICHYRSEKVNELYKHMNDDHGGTGGEWPVNMDENVLLVGVDVDETLDVEFQHMLLQTHQQR